MTSLSRMLTSQPGSEDLAASSPDKSPGSTGSTIETKPVKKGRRLKSTGATSASRHHYGLVIRDSDGRLIIEKEFSSENAAKWESATSHRPYAVLEFFQAEVDLGGKEPVIKRMSVQSISAG